MKLLALKNKDLETRRHGSPAFRKPQHLFKNLTDSIFLLLLPLSRVISSLGRSSAAHKPDRKGILVTGSVMDKWVDETNNQLTYYVRYSYLSHLNAKQTVDKHTFHQLERGDEVLVMYHTDQPLVSRLVID